MLPHLDNRRRSTSRSVNGKSFTPWNLLLLSVVCAVAVKAGQLSRRFAASAGAVLAALSLLMGGSLDLGSRASEGGFDFTELQESRVSSTPRLTPPHGALPGCEQSTVEDCAEEVEAEVSSVTDRTRPPAVPNSQARELTSGNHCHIAIGLVEWLRDQHAARGPPLV